MPVGRFLDDPALPTLTLSGVNPSADRFLVHDDSANSVAQIVASQILDRILNTADISWMGTLGSLGAIDPALDQFIVYDADANAFKKLAATRIIDQLLVTLDISSLSALANWAALDGVDDKMLVWDESGTAFKTLLLTELQKRVLLVDNTDYTSSPQTLLAADSGKLCTNIGSAVDITFTLPNAAVGQRFSFMRHIQKYIRITPQGGHVIGDGAAGKYLEMTTRGRIDLQCWVTGFWSIVNASCLYEFQA